MARSCTVCLCAERDAVDAALVAGEPNRRIAARYGLSETSVRRHKASHLPAAVVSAGEAAEVERADELLGQARALQERALSILGNAEKAGDLRAAVLSCREARACLELLARLLGVLDSGGTLINVQAIAGAGSWGPNSGEEARLKLAEKLSSIAAAPRPALDGEAV